MKTLTAFDYMPAASDAARTSKKSWEDYEPVKDKKNNGETNLQRVKVNTHLDGPCHIIHVKAEAQEKEVSVFPGVWSKRNRRGPASARGTYREIDKIYCCEEGRSEEGHAETEPGSLVSEKGRSVEQPPEIFGGASVVVRCH
jgi:hypothetical protein